MLCCFCRQSDVDIGWYGAWYVCPGGTFVCGIQLRYYYGDNYIRNTYKFADMVGLNGVSFRCCFF